jgi:leader peptidase (prepilin peptidase) / N-methyltransferase
MDLLVSGVASFFVFTFGICIGSFLNVVIYRIPAGLSLLFPPSRCPKCLHRLSKHDNVPVFGWLWLRGRCRYCKTRIPVRYPLVEAATGLLFLLVFWAFSVPLPALGFWAFLSWLLALALIDFDTMTLPGALTKSGLVAGLVFQAALGWTESASFAGVANRLMVGIVGAVVGIWLFDLITIVGSFAFGQTAMGGGDAKLAAMIGAWLGWKYLLLTGFLACAIGAFAGGGGMAIGLISRRQPMPFGPFLAIGAALSLFFGDALISAYLRTFFPTLY